MRQGAGPEIGTDYQVPGSPTAGRDTGRQIHFLRPLILCNFNNAIEAFGSIGFRVEVPDSRLRVNVALIGEPNAGASDHFIGPKNLLLWLRAVEDSIQFGTEVPITNLWGTGAAASPIPGVVNLAGAQVNDPNLGGFSREFTTAGRAIIGTITTPNPSVHNGNGNLTLQVRYTADGVTFRPAEWEEIRKACGNQPSYVGASSALMVG